MCENKLSTCCKHFKFCLNKKSITFSNRPAAKTAGHLIPRGGGGYLTIQSYEDVRQFLGGFGHEISGNRMYFLHKLSGIRV